MTPVFSISHFSLAGHEMTSALCFQVKFKVSLLSFHLCWRSKPETNVLKHISSSIPTKSHTVILSNSPALWHYFLWIVVVDEVWLSVAGAHFFVQLLWLPALMLITLLVLFVPNHCYSCWKHKVHHFLCDRGGKNVLLKSLLDEWNYGENKAKPDRL